MSWVMVSWVATASSSTVESRARRFFPLITPVASITARTASKIRSGAPEARSLLRHSVSTVGWKPGSARDSPAATFQAMLVRSSPAASRSDSPSKACRTMTVATTSAGTEGRPLPEGNRSAKAVSGNSALRWAAKKAATDPVGTRCPHRAAASSSSGWGSLVPCIRPAWLIRAQIASTRG